MELSVLSRKRPLFDEYAEQPSLYSKKCLEGLKTLLDRYQIVRSDKDAEEEKRITHARVKTSRSHPCSPEVCLNGQKKLNGTKSFSEQILVWADTQYSVKKVLQHLKLKQATSDIFLNDSINNKFLEFHHDITEECGAEDKQHSWAVIEKREEIVMYGPYYPNYNNGEHSEDIIITQTQELLESESVSDNWNVYVFTMNSPCLSRNTDSCMLNLIQKAQEWWTVYGVKTHIGFVKCWGFKGTKENLFRDISYSQLDCIEQTEDHESYVKAAQKNNTDHFNQLSENLYSAVKQLLGIWKVNLTFPLISFVRSMHGILESKPEQEGEVLTQEMSAMIAAAAQVLLSEKNESLEEYLQRGRAFACNYSFRSQVSDTTRDQLRLTFQQCWREMVQDKYAEFIREKLTEDFNECTVQLFIQDIAKFTKEFIQIGKIRLSDGKAK